MSYSISKLGKVFAVINQDETVTVYSRLLNKKEKRELKKSGKLPDGVTTTERHPIVETFPTVHEAQVFIEHDCKPVTDLTWGVFKSKDQYSLAKKLVAG